MRRCAGDGAATPGASGAAGAQESPAAVVVKKAPLLLLLWWSLLWCCMRQRRVHCGLNRRNAACCREDSARCGPPQPPPEPCDADGDASDHAKHPEPWTQPLQTHCENVFRFRFFFVTLPLSLFSPLYLKKIEYQREGLLAKAIVACSRLSANHEAVFCSVIHSTLRGTWATDLYSEELFAPDQRHGE